jgi:hypothetical protein
MNEDEFDNHVRTRKNKGWRALKSLTEEQRKRLREILNERFDERQDQTARLSTGSD